MMKILIEAVDVMVDDDGVWIMVKRGQISETKINKLKSAKVGRVAFVEIPEA